MAKIKDDNSWRYGGIRRRDFRHGGVDENDFAPVFRYHSKHNKRTPCDKAGVPHDFVLKSCYTYAERTFETLICRRCGKHGYYTRRNWPVNPD